MFWIFMAVVGLSLVMVKLGALSVWVHVLSVALGVLVAVVAVSAGVLLWRRLLRRA